MDKRGAAVFWIIVFIVLISITAYLYIRVDNAILKASLLVLLVVVVLGSASFLYFEYGRGASKIRKKIKEISPLLPQRSAEELKDRYMEIYRLYMKLSEKHKRNFYSRVTRIREQMEESLKAELKIGELLAKARKGSIQERKEAYDEVQKLYGKLPQQVQDQYHENLLTLKEELEHGSPGAA